MTSVKIIIPANVGAIGQHNRHRGELMHAELQLLDDGANAIIHHRFGIASGSALPILSMMNSRCWIGDIISKPDGAFPFLRIPTSTSDIAHFAVTISRNIFAPLAKQRPHLLLSHPLAVYFMALTPNFQGPEASLP